MDVGKMAPMLQRFFLVFLMLGTVKSHRDPDACEHIKKSCGPLPPIVPESFVIRGEHIEKANKIIYWDEGYFDSVNLRAKYMYLSKGIEHHYLFDYNVSQIISYAIVHPGTSIKKDPFSEMVCKADSMAFYDSRYRDIFGYRGGQNEVKRSRMFNANQVLRFGGQYQYAFNDSVVIEERGLPADVFQGCIYDPWKDKTSSVNYYWSRSELSPSGGGDPSLLDGWEDRGYVNVPLKTEFCSITHKRNTATNKLESKREEEVEHFSYFASNPEFDDKNFRIPPWMYCDNYRGWKPMRKFPLAFSVRMELTEFTIDMFGKKNGTEVSSFSELFYYNEKGLARRDYTPIIGVDTDIFSNFGNYGPVKTIYDFNLGIVHIVNRASGKCYSRAITFGDFFETSKDLLDIEMGPPEDFFLMQQTDMEYKGEDFTRDINCDVWGGRYFDDINNLTYYKETYMSTVKKLIPEVFRKGYFINGRRTRLKSEVTSNDFLNGWHSDAEEDVEYGVPLKHTVISRAYVDGDLKQKVRENNFFKFKAYPPPLVVFDITGCVENNKHRFFAILLNVQYKDTLMKNKFMFLQSAQYHIAELSEVNSPLRVQRMDIGQIQHFMYVSFALVEKPKIRTQTPPTTSGRNLEDAIQQLGKAIDSGSFQVQIRVKGSEEPYVVVAAPGSLYKVDDQGRLSAPINENVRVVRDAGNDIPEYPVMRDDKKDAKPEEKNGMSPGALAGLAIAMLLIGFAIGVGIMYLYLKKYSAEGTANQYALQEKPSS